MFKEISKDLKFNNIALIVLFGVLLFFVDKTIDLNHKIGELKGRLKEITEIKSLDGFLTVKQAVQRYDVKNTTLYSQIKDGSLSRFIFDGKYVLIDEELKLRYKKKPLN